MFPLLNFIVSKFLDIFSIENGKEIKNHYYSYFAKTGNPKIEGKLDWPEYTVDSRNYLILGKTIENRKGLREEKVNLINEAYERSRVIADQ